MICGSCGTDNPTGARFCNSCGARLASGCPSCGAQNVPGARFCNECGSALQAAAPAGAALRPGQEPPTRSSVAPEHAPVAERRLVTILFADLVGFTTFAEGRDAEEVRELLTRYFDLCRQLIERYGGTVEKFIGDAVMAVFGAPVTRENDAERAVRAAMELVDAVPTLAPGLQARGGVLTGEAAVTLGATNQGMVAGDLVNTASRLQSAAPAGMVLVGEATQRATSNAIAYEAAGEQALKGKATPVSAWIATRVVAEVGGRNRAETLEAPFVGRDEELRWFKELFHATGREGRARLVSVVGPAGVGKSRLAWEFLKYADGLLEENWWHQGRSPAYGQGLSFWALGEMVRVRCGLLEGDDERRTRERVADTVAQFVTDPDERRWIETALLALLGVGQAPGGGEALFPAWRTFFDRMAQQDPVVMVFEDLHWADAGTMDFIDHLLEWSKGLPYFVVTLARPELLERRPDWGAGKRSFTSLPLEPLPEPAMRQLLAGLVPGLPESAVRSIVGRADGMPLYAVETVRMLLADGKLREEDGRYVPAGDLSDLAVPDSLTALISARLDALEPVDRTILQDGSVLGTSFTLPGLAAVAGMDPAGVEGRLRGLVRRELLRVEADPRSPERGQYAFVQALIREVAYNTLAKRDRKALHLAAARWFEAAGSDELAGVLARHYFAAWQATPAGPEADALAAQARVALVGAADRAVALGAHDQAIEYLRQALDVTTDRPAEAELLMRIGGSASATADHVQAEEALRAALQIVEGLGDVRTVIAATAELARVMLNAYRTGPALEVIAAAPAVGDELAGDPAVIQLRAEHARALMFNSDARGAIRVSDQVLEAAERANLVPLIAEALVTRGTSLAQAARMYEGQGVIEAGRQLAEAHGLTRTILRALNNQGGLFAATDPRRSYQVQRQAVDLARRAGNRAQMVNGSANVANAALRTGDWRVAREMVEAVLAEDLDPADRASLRTSWAPIVAAMGEEVNEGLAEIEAGLAGVTDPQSLAEWDLAQGWVALAQGRYAESCASWLRCISRTAGPAFATEYGAVARASLWNDDLPGIRRALDGLESMGAHGPALEADRVAMRAAIAGLEGRRSEAVAGYRALRSALADLGLRLDLGLLGIDMLTALGADDPDAREMAEESRRALADLGARPFLAALDRLLAAVPAATPAEGSGVSG